MVSSQAEELLDSKLGNTIADRFYYLLLNTTARTDQTEPEPEKETEPETERNRAEKRKRQNRERKRKNENETR